MHYLLVAPVFFALVFTFYAYLSESVSRLLIKGWEAESNKLMFYFVAVTI